MKIRELRKLVKQFGGWIERDGDDYIARFPTPHIKAQFERALNA